MQRCRIVVRTRPGDPAQGILTGFGRSIPVALGRSGIRANKREGDAGTPRGEFRLVRLWWRPDRLPRPQSLLPIRRITQDLGWCEDPAHRLYNQAIHLRREGEGDRLWRADNLYDLVIELDHNTRPRVKNRGSAVFIHVARPGLAPTAGCVAMPRPALQRLITDLRRKSRILIQ